MPTTPISPLAKKLLVKPGQRIAIVNAPADYACLLEPLPEGARVTEDAGDPVDAVHLFVGNAVELERFAASALQAARPNGLVWIAYRKGGAKASTDLNRDILHGAVEKAYGWQGVALVSINEVWSAMRFKPDDQAGK